jgi:predicted anti-sigma-YlaC factor YlaD
MNCEEAKVNIPGYIDGRLDAAASKELRNHLESCESCRSIHEEVSSFLGYLDKHKNIDVPEGMKEEFWERAILEELPVQK